MCDGDFDSDGNIDGGEMLTIGGCFGKSAPYSPASCEDTDMNDNGVIDGVDWGAFGKAFTNGANGPGCEDFSNGCE